MEIFELNSGIQDVWRKLTRVAIIIHVNLDGFFGDWVRGGDALVVFSGAKDAGYNVIQVPLLQWYGRDGVLGMKQNSRCNLGAVVRKEDRERKGKRQVYRA